jgi:DNA-binding transcriptional LysR family regulator
MDEELSMNITFRQVDAFRAVVSSGSVTGASEQLGVSQPAISRLISDLESEVGFALFTRQGRVLVPTREGRMLVAEVRQAVTGMEHIKTVASVIASFGHTAVQLVTIPSFSGGLAADLIAQFADKNTQVKMCMEIEANDDTVEWLVSQSHDFGLTTSVPANPALAHLPLEMGRVFCVLPQNHALAGKSEIVPDDLHGECYVSYMAGSRFRHDIDSVFDVAKVARELRFETRTTDAICQLVARGLGVSVVATSNATQDFPGCVLVPFKSELNIQAVLIWSKNRQLSPPAIDFLDMVRNPAMQ